MTGPISYKDSGVDIDKGDFFVERIKQMVKSTYDKRTHSAVGGFASLYKMDEERFLAAGTDGVGTKLKVAQILDKHDTIGIDLVAMCVNDIICTGANPLFFLDYFATSELDVAKSEKIIQGIVEGCKQSHMVLIGGETAEMPGMYQNGDYDLAGFAVGEVFRKGLIDGQAIQAGDSIIGIASSGVHSNGFSLVRKLINPDETELLEMALTPTKIYVRMVKDLLTVMHRHIKGIAHITGGGVHNIPRLNSHFDYHLTNLPSLEEVPPIFSVLKERSRLPNEELYKTFNMGIGMAVITDMPEMILERLETIGQKAWNMGHVTEGEGKVYLNE